MRRITATILVLTQWTASSACLASAAVPAADDILRVAGFQGGLIVHVGCGGGKLTAALRSADNVLVQGLDTDPANIAAARAHFQSLQLAGPVSAVVFDGRHLPYADNLVNLIVAEDSGEVALDEFTRVLRPGGVLCVKHGEQWTTTIKPWPAELGQWTHYLHGPDNNAVSPDTVVGPPRHIQWISGPRFLRSHDHLASVSAVVSARGRLFSIVDAGSIAFAAAHPRWRLVARDAFSGVRLWEREISTWEYHLRDFRSGPADLARRLVAVEDRVYVTLGYGQPITALDAATGRTVLTYDDTEGAQEILHYDDMLLVLLGRRHEDWASREAQQIVSQDDYHPPFERNTPPSHEQRIMAVEADTGRLVWHLSHAEVGHVMPSTLAAEAGRVFFQNADSVVCLDAGTGARQWLAPRPIHRHRLAWSTPTLVVQEGVVFSADRRAARTEGELLWIPSGGYHEYIRGADVEGELIAWDAKTGARLWSCPAYEGFNAPVDVLLADGLVWTGRYAWGNDPGVTHARDPRTGAVRRQRPADQESLSIPGHARCHRAKATAKYLILGRWGVEFVDLQSGDITANFWIRGTCQYGVMPANGLLYVPPHPCTCYYSDLIKSGFLALAPERRTEPVSPPASEPLRRGPAFGSISPVAESADPQAWPTYRGDPARSGATTVDLARDFHVRWETPLEGRLTAPVVAEGLMFVARSEAHQLVALDAADGRVRWTWTAGGRIDSPPSIGRGRVFFGSADGHVYVLRLEDGALIWQFRAAPDDHQIVVDEQLESVWPVPGNALVLDHAVYFVAGRNSYLDGGMRLYKLDAATGQTLDVRHLEIDQEARDRGVASGGCLPDILSSDGDSLFLRTARFDLDLVRQPEDVPHLFSSLGFVDDSWWHRSYWQFGTFMGSGWGGWPRAGQQVPAGRLLVTDGERIFGFGRSQYHNPGAHVGVDAGGVWGPIGEGLSRWTFYRLFGRALETASDDAARRSEPAPPREPHWTRQVPVLCQAMVLAGPTLLVAGPPDPTREIPRRPSDVDPLAEALQSDRGGRLLAISVADGTTLAEIALTSPPVFDGMAVAHGHIYLSTKIGAVVCLEPVQ
jgi:outer membrane protein assembly factor BamB